MRINMSLSKETLLPACQHNLRQTEDDIRMTVLLREEVHDNNLNGMRQRHDACENL